MPAPRKRPIVIKYVDGDYATHSIEEPICTDDSCICALCEYELLVRETSKPVKKQRAKRTLVNWTSDSDKASLNGNRAFRLLK